MTAHEILQAITSGAMKLPEIPAAQVAELKDIIKTELDYIYEDRRQIDMTIFPHRRVELENKASAYRNLLAIL